MVHLVGHSKGKQMSLSFQKVSSTCCDPSTDASAGNGAMPADEPFCVHQRCRAKPSIRFSKNCKLRKESSGDRWHKFPRAKKEPPLRKRSASLTMTTLEAMSVVQDAAGLGAMPVQDFFKVSPMEPLFVHQNECMRAWEVGTTM